MNDQQAYMRGEIKAKMPAIKLDRTTQSGDEFQM